MFDRRRDAGLHLGYGQPDHRRLLRHLTWRESRRSKQAGCTNEGSGPADAGCSKCDHRGGNGLVRGPGHVPEPQDRTGRLRLSRWRGDAGQRDRERQALPDRRAEAVWGRCDREGACARA